jgi:hypothetical protein
LGACRRISQGSSGHVSTLPSSTVPELNHETRTIFAACPPKKRVRTLTTNSYALQHVKPSRYRSRAISQHAQPPRTIRRRRHSSVCYVTLRRLQIRCFSHHTLMALGMLGHIFRKIVGQVRSSDCRASCSCCHAQIHQLRACCSSSHLFPTCCCRRRTMLIEFCLPAI